MISPFHAGINKHSKKIVSESKNNLILLSIGTVSPYWQMKILKANGYPAADLLTPLHHVGALLF